MRASLRMRIYPLVLINTPSSTSVLVSDKKKKLVAAHKLLPDFQRGLHKARDDEANRLPLQYHHSCYCAFNFLVIAATLNQM